jgi:hypothetical protein
LPAGNSFLDRMHANILDAKFHNGEARIQWRLQPCDRTPNYVEIWFPAEFNPVGYTVAVKDPGGVERASLPVGLVGRNRDRMCLIHNDDNRTVGQFSVDQHRKHRWRALIITAPSDPEHPGCPAIEAGAWTIVINRALTAAKLGPQGIRCWVQRDSDPESLRSGARQSYFDQAQDIRYNDDGSMREMDTTKALVRRFGSLSGLATGPQSTAVAGVRLAAGLGSSPNQVRPAQYSCAGTQSAEASEPRIACSSMSDRSKALPGTVAAGTRSGSRSVLQGTSMAAPFVARQLATTFVSASDRAVKKAELGNYLDLLRGYRPDQPNDRLGQVLVSAHRQPGIERETA